MCPISWRGRTPSPSARERAQQTEADRRVGDDMIERMRQADLFRIMQPRSYGGLEHGFDVFAQVVAAIARGCGSTGWVYGLLASHQWLIACFSKAAQDEVWQDRTALAAGTYAPVGQAVAVDGGYRLSGVGSFCSGCDNAQWQLLGGMIPQPGAAATPGFFLLRSADCTIPCLRRAYRCHRPRHARQSQPALSAVVPRRAADHHRVAGTRDGGRRARRFPRDGGR